MSIADHELIRARWRRALDAAALDRHNRKDFGLSALGQRLRATTVQLILLPVDPEGDTVTIDDSFAEWLTEQRTVDLNGTTFTLPQTQRRTAHAIALVDSYGNGHPWETYLAVHRSGAIEFGLGRSGGWDQQDRNGNPVRGIALTPTVARVWATLRLAAALHEKCPLGEPLQLTVGVVNTAGASLGILGEGWAEPDDFNNNVAPCADANLLWHLELATVPHEAGAREIAFSIGDRLEDAWGLAQRRYLALRGPHVGKMDPRFVH